MLEKLENSNATLIFLLSVTVALFLFEVLLFAL